MRWKWLQWKYVISVICNGNTLFQLYGSTEMTMAYSSPRNNSGTEIQDSKGWETALRTKKKAVLNQTEFELKREKKVSSRVGDKKGPYALVSMCESILLICLLTG